MMVSYSSTIVAALLADTAVSNLAGTRIYLEDPPVSAAFPCITFAQTVTANSGADDSIKSVSVVFDVEAWVRGSSAWALASAIETVFAAQGYVCQFMQDVPPSGGVYQVSMKFQTIKEL